MTGELEAFSVVVKDVDHSLVGMCLLLRYVSESFGVLKCIKGIREVWTEARQRIGALHWSNLFLTNDMKIQLTISG